MSSHSTPIIAFDLYGTLLSTDSVRDSLASLVPDATATSTALLWRRYQLEYTWRLNSMGLYKPFDDVTLASLKHSLLEHGIILREEELQRLMHAYNSLSTFRDVSCGLRLLKSTPSLKSVVFSNGTSTMISSSINNSPSLSPHASVFQDLISVDEIGCYKPSPRTYHHLITRLELGQTKTDIERTWLVSSNPFDVIGAANLGMKTVWVNRSGGKGWIDCLGDLASGGLKPTMIVKGVDEAVEKIIGWVPTKDANPTPRL